MVSMVSRRTTIEVKVRTRERINAVKGPLSADDLINLALDHLPPDRVVKLYEDWQRAAMKALHADARLRGHIYRRPGKR